MHGRVAPAKQECEFLDASCRPSARGRRTAPRAGRGRAERGRPRAAASRREHRPTTLRAAGPLRAARPSAPTADRRGSTRENATGINRGTPWSTTFSRASSFSMRTTPACSSELLPTPLAPYSTVIRYARRLSATIADHSSRPKNHSASDSEYGTRPWYGEGRARTAASAGTARLMRAVRASLRPTRRGRSEGSRFPAAPRT